MMRLMYGVMKVEKKLVRVDSRLTWFSLVMAPREKDRGVSAAGRAA